METIEVQAQNKVAGRVLQVGPFLSTAYIAIKGHADCVCTARDLRDFAAACVSVADAIEPVPAEEQSEPIIRRGYVGPHGPDSTKRAEPELPDEIVYGQDGLSDTLGTRVKKHNALRAYIVRQLDRRIAALEEMKRNAD